MYLINRKLVDFPRSLSAALCKLFCIFVRRFVRTSTFKCSLSLIFNLNNHSLACANLVMGGQLASFMEMVQLQKCKQIVNNSRNNMTLVARKVRAKQRGRFSSYNHVVWYSVPVRDSSNKEQCS